MSEKQTKNTFEPSMIDHERRWRAQAEDVLEHFMKSLYSMPETRQIRHLKAGFIDIFIKKEREKLEQRERDLKTNAELMEQLELAHEKIRRLQAPKG